jgi:hypothetical protein
LEALSRALGDPAGVGITGPTPFFRPTATLGIVIVSSLTSPGDDVGRQPVGEIVDAITRLTAQRDQAGVLVLIATPGAACGGAPDPAAANPRLVAFADALAPNSLAVSLCPDALPRAFGALFGTHGQHLAAPCLHRIRDVDPATDGLQVDCVVEDAVRTAEGPGVLKVLPRCEDGPPPCWRLL